jgi:AcrR family transcriptional regulator
VAAETQGARGRPAAATRGDVVAAATRRFLAGERVDLLAIASELGVGRATLYRWFGSRGDLIAEVIVAQLVDLVAAARARAGGRGGPALLETFDRVNRALAAAQPLRRWLEDERQGALRLLTASNGPVQPRVVEAIAALIEDEEQAGAYEPPVDAQTLAYAIVRLFEAFIYNDATIGIRGDVGRLYAVQAALLGVHPAR